MSDFVQFETNVPQELELAYDDGILRETQFGDKVFYTLTDGRTLSVKPAVSGMIAEKGIGRRQPFLMCKVEVRKPGARKATTEWRVTPKDPEAPPQAAAPRPQPAAGPDMPPEPPGFPDPPPQRLGPTEVDLEQQLRTSIKQVELRRAGASVVAPTPVRQIAEATHTHSNGNNHGNGHANGNGLNGHANGHATLPERPKTKLEDALKTVVQACHSAREYAKQIGYEAMPPFTSEDIRTMANTIMIQDGGGKQWPRP